MRNAIGLAILVVFGLLQPVQAQVLSSQQYLSLIRPIPPLAFPDQPIEGEPAAVPRMGIYKPSGPGPFAAVLLHHTCGGVMEHIGVWTKLLLGSGYVVFVLDSLSQRNASGGVNCSLPFRVGPGHGATDAFHALEHLATQPYVDANRVAMFGLSWGAMTSLLAARKDFQEGLPRKRRDLNFRAIASVYPHCLTPGIRVPNGTVDIEFLGQDTNRPLLVLMGALDEETPPKFCLPRLESLKAKSAPVEWHVFPGTTHGWDQARSHGYRAQTLSGGSHTYQYSSESTQASQKMVLDFLKRVLQ
ncbi:MAG: prolyl oligopeptidase [Alphaproteobacteria bacterium]|nr:prolyl oligopeptidase [Alphaproteobacteria bacterium]